MDELAKVYPSGNVPDKGRSRDRPGQQKKKRKKLRRFAKSHLADLTRIAEEAHQILKQKGSPFRLCIYERQGDIFIDVVTLDEHGNQNEVFHQDISHHELESLIRQIKTGRGLVFDARA